MKDAQSRVALQRFLKVAIPVVDALPPTERADVYEGIAVACKGVDSAMQKQALATARTLREANSAQLYFKKLLK